VTAGSAGAVAPAGILLVDKPHGLTSHDVVARVRRLAGTRKVGHAGTLDPMATGLLILGVGSATRLLTYIVGVDKRYEATIRLGAATTTDDAEGETVATASAHDLGAVDDADIHAGIARLTGALMQIPSSVSAIKVDGKRAYARVRGGEDVQLAARSVTVSAFELLTTEHVRAGEGLVAIDLTVAVECSSGTYIRALARDLGAALGVGGHLTALRRTRVGPFSIQDAATLENLPVTERLLVPADAAAALMPGVALTAAQTVDLGHGKRLPAAELHTLAGSRSDDRILTDGVPLAALAPDGRLVGLVEVRDGRTRVLVNFPTDAGMNGARA